MKANPGSLKRAFSLHKSIIATRCAPYVVLLALSLAGITSSPAATVDHEIIDHPEAVSLDRSSTGRWQALFNTKPAWVTRQIAFLETRQSPLRLSLLISRLLYLGDPWTRRNEPVATWRWQQDTIEVRQAILRSLRAYREPIIAEYLCRYLTIEKEPSLVISALVTLSLIEPTTGQMWAFRLADPRSSTPPLIGSSSTSVRQQALEFLIENRGLDSRETGLALDWALLRVTDAERNHAIRQIPRGKISELLTATIIKLVEEYRTAVADPLGKQALVLAIGKLDGYANLELVNALMYLVVHGERAAATTAATALATTLQWDAPVAINDLAERAAKDPDAVVRQSLTAFLLRLDPLSVTTNTPANGPWATLANHQLLLNQWTAPTPLTTPPAAK